MLRALALRQAPAWHLQERLKSSAGCPEHPSLLLICNEHVVPWKGSIAPPPSGSMCQIRFPLKCHMINRFQIARGVAPYGSEDILWDGARWAQQVQIRPASPAHSCHHSCVLLPWEAHCSKALTRFPTAQPAQPRLVLAVSTGAALRMSALQLPNTNLCPRSSAFSCCR